MDELVLKGMAKWPNVPAVYGWLSLDRRGNWLIKDETISNPVVSAFIGRNYERDSHGRWFFQNGPQRVFVKLEYTPVVYRAVNGDSEPLALETHFGAPATALSGAWIDELGAVLIDTEHGVGVVHDRDLEHIVRAFIDANGNALPEDTLDELMELIRQGRSAPLWLKYRDSNVKVEAIRSTDAATRFDFRTEPAEGKDEARRVRA